MKKLLFSILILFVSIFIFTCSGKKQILTVWLDSHPENSASEDTPKNIPIYYGEEEPEYYNEVLIDSIQGFSYEEGHRYKLLVQKKKTKAGHIYLKLVKQLLKEKEDERKLDYFVGYFTYQDKIPYFTDCLTERQFSIQEKSEYFKAKDEYLKLFPSIDTSKSVLLKFKGEFGFEVNKEGIPVSRVYKMRKFGQFDTINTCADVKKLEGKYRCKEVPYLLQLAFYNNYGFSVYVKKANSEFLMRNGFWMRKSDDLILIRMVAFKKKERMHAFAYCRIDFLKRTLTVVESNIIEFKDKIFQKEN